jgi:excinuclease ABC subunit B
LAADGAEYQPDQIPKIVEELEREMKKAATSLEFEKAAQLRDRIVALKDLQLGVTRSTIGVKGFLGSGAMLAAQGMGRSQGGRGQPQPTRRRRR